VCFCRVHKWVEGTDIAQATGTANPHTSHCLGSGEIMISTMGGPEGQVRGQEGGGGFVSFCGGWCMLAAHQLLLIDLMFGYMCSACIMTRSLNNCRHSSLVLWFD
jgi:hypothetical protein